MKNYLLLGVLLVFSLQLQAQEPACMPDTTFREAGAGVYPLPLSEMFPNQGITDSACLNQPFNFVFTVVTPDSIAIPFGPIVLESPLTSISIVTDTAIGGLPEGITYACYPPNCVFTPENLLGCIVLSGTATSGADVGENPLSIQATVSLPAISIPISFPDATLFPGSYSLYVFGEDATQCLSTGLNELNEISGFSISPNPSNGRAELWIESLESGIYSVETFNLIGERVLAKRIQLFQGINNIPLEGEQLSEGMYIVSISNGKQRASRRMVINR